MLWHPSATVRSRMKVIPVHPNDVDHIALIARRMQSTLVEVLGAERGAQMYTMTWLRQRVREHLGREDAAQ